MFLIFFMIVFVWFEDLDFSNTALIITNVIIVFLTFSAVYSYIDQTRLIKRRNSAECIHIDYGLLILLGSAMAISYGVYELLFMTMASAIIRCIAMAWQLIVVHSVKPFRKFDWVVVGVFTVVLVVGSLPGFTIFVFTCVLVFIFLRGALVPLDMLLKRTRGDLNFKSILITMFGQIIWICYGLFVQKPFMYQSYGCFLALTLVMLLLWLKFPRRYLLEIHSHFLLVILCNIYHRKNVTNLDSLIDITDRETVVVENIMTCDTCKRTFIEKIKF